VKRRFEAAGSGFDIALDKLDISASVKLNVPDRKVEKLFLNFDAYQAVVWMPLRHVYRYDTTASADIQHSFLPLQGNEVCEQDGIEGESISSFFL
jgi:hypothetical protein